MLAPHDGRFWAQFAWPFRLLAHPTLHSSARGIEQRPDAKPSPHHVAFRSGSTLRSVALLLCDGERAWNETGAVQPSSRLRNRIAPQHDDEGSN
jgi:hypothetical protein